MKLSAKELSAFIKGNPSPRQIQRKQGAWHLCDAMERHLVGKIISRIEDNPLPSSNFR